MKISIWKSLLLAACLLAGLPAKLRADSYAITAYAISGGGGASSNGPYTLNAAIALPGLSAPMTSCTYNISTSFFAIGATNGATNGPTQTPQPSLTIAYSANTVTISWPDTGCYTLQQTSDLAAPMSWVSSAYPMTSANGVNTVTITPPVGNVFFRLSSPGP